MDDPVQAAAYAMADFDEPHGMFIETFQSRFPGLDISGNVLDLGCGAADITVRFARAFPSCRLYAVDGAAAMLYEGRSRVASEGLDGRIEFIQGLIPGTTLPAIEYDVIISNSLLHHLHNPAGFWEFVGSLAGNQTTIFIMDLIRPDNESRVQELVNTYADAEPPVLRRDFYNSLCAAFTPEEVALQLTNAGISSLKIDEISDRHMIIISH